MRSYYVWIFSGMTCSTCSTPCLKHYSNRQIFSSLNAHLSPKTRIKPEIMNNGQSIGGANTSEKLLSDKMLLSLYAWLMRIYTLKCWLHSSEYFCAIYKFSTPLFCIVHLFKLRIFSQVLNTVYYPRKLHEKLFICWSQKLQISRHLFPHNPCKMRR